jgi:8-oxo-dGTP pyrophosphatase MutT (NUDIX family)
MHVRAGGRTLLVRKRHTTFSLQSGGKIDPGETTPSAHMQLCGAFVDLRG